MDFFLFNAVNKLWYIMGDESCGQVSSKLCVCGFRQERQYIICGATPPVEPLRRFFENAVNNFWYITGDYGCGQVSSKL